MATWHGMETMGTSLVLGHGRAHIIRRYRVTNRYAISISRIASVRTRSRDTNGPSGKGRLSVFVGIVFVELNSDRSLKRYLSAVFGCTLSCTETIISNTWGVIFMPWLRSFQFLTCVRL